MRWLYFLAAGWPGGWLESYLNQPHILLEQVIDQGREMHPWHWQERPMRLVTGFILILLAFALGGFTRGNNAHVFMDRLSVMSIVRHHQKLSMIASVTNQGKTRWMIIDEAFDAEKPIEFLQAMIKGTGKKVILILNHLRVHHSRLVKAWVAERKSD